MKENCLFCAISGLECRSVDIEDDLTVLVDSIKYREIEKTHHHPRNADLLNKTNSSVCENPETEEYQKCGNNCILGCRYDNSSSGITISKDECNKTACVEGCFCKPPLVRHLNKCIPAKECPVRASRGIDILTNFENAGPLWKHFQFFKPMSCQGSGCICQGSACQSGCNGSSCGGGGGGGFGCGLKGCTPVYIYNHNSAKPGNNIHFGWNENRSKNQTFQRIIFFTDCSNGGCESSSSSSSSSSEEHSDESGYSSEEDCSKCNVLVIALTCARTENLVYTHSQNKFSNYNRFSFLL